DSALIFIANADGYASYGRLQPDLTTSTIPRADAIVRFFHLWDAFQHIGDVPSEEEIQRVINQHAVSDRMDANGERLPVEILLSQMKAALASSDEQEIKDIIGKVQACSQPWGSNKKAKNKMLKELQSRLEDLRTKAADSGPCSDAAVLSSAKDPSTEGRTVPQELLESCRAAKSGEVDLDAVSDPGDCPSPVRLPPVCLWDIKTTVPSSDKIKVARVTR
ncbi:MAG: hypothetical protein GY768_23825, partial [Planctomycetaceae bacterium]|nr:hypothetical protein [Planctomycetaceae bacterium]